MTVCQRCTESDPEPLFTRRRHGWCPVEGEMDAAPSAATGAPPMACNSPGPTSAHPISNMGPMASKAALPNWCLITGSATSYQPQNCHQLAQPAADRPVAVTGGPQSHPDSRSPYPPDDPHGATHPTHLHSRMVDSVPPPSAQQRAHHLARTPPVRAACGPVNGPTGPAAGPCSPCSRSG